MKKFLVASAAGAMMMVSATAALADGKETYSKVCFACHATGVAGAPKVGDKAAWAPRIAQGIPTLVKHVTEGYKGKTGVMPPKGTCMQCSDADLKAAVEYIVSQAK